MKASLEPGEPQAVTLQGHGRRTGPALLQQLPLPMQLLLIALLLVIALAVGWLLGRRRLHAVELELATARAELKAAAEIATEREEMLAFASERLRAGFDAVAGEALRGNSEMFLQMARQALGRRSRSRESRRSAPNPSARCAPRSREWRSASRRCRARRETW